MTQQQGEQTLSDTAHGVKGRGLTDTQGVSQPENRDDSTARAREAPKGHVARSAARPGAHRKPRPWRYWIKPSD